MSLIPKEALSHILKEIALPNVIISLENSYGKIRKAHNSIHEFLYLAPLCLPSATKDVNWHQKSAFLTYHYQASDQVHRSFLEALSGYYNAGYVLLRSTLELLLYGAFWECLTYKKFRDKAQIIEKKVRIKIDSTRKTIINWLNDVIAKKPSIEKELEEVSAGIFDKIAPLFQDEQLRKLVPLPKIIIKQLTEWKIFDPIPEPMREIYGVNSNLSADVHVIPDRTDIGRRLLSQKDIFEIEVIPEELNKFIEFLHKVMDVGIVIELNVLNDWISQSGETKAKLKKRLQVLEDLGLRFSSEKLKSLVEV